MKINVVARKYDEIFESLVFDDSISFNVVEYPYFNDFVPDFLILLNPTPLEFACDYRLLKKVNQKCRFIVIADNTCKAVFNAFMPELIFIDSKSSFDKKLLLNECCQRIHDYDFSSLEFDFIAKLSLGLNLQEIADSLGLTERSVRRVKEKLLKKTNLFSLQQLLIFSTMIEIINIHSY